MTAALDIAADGGVGHVGRERFEIRLRDEQLADGARSKVVETVHPVWINPPAETAAFIRWAAERYTEAPDLRPIHLVALMATYPFFGDITAAVGRMLRSSGAVDSLQVRGRMKAQWGDRDAVSVATRKCLLTLRSFGVISGDRGSTTSTAGERFCLSGDWAMWAVGALLLTRGSEMIDAPTVESAPEFFFLDVRVPATDAYPLLERLTSGDGRTVHSLRLKPGVISR